MAEVHNHSLTVILSNKRPFFEFPGDQAFLSKLQDGDSYRIPAHVELIRQLLLDQPLPLLELSGNDHLLQLVVDILTDLASCVLAGKDLLKDFFVDRVFHFPFPLLNVFNLFA